MHLFSTAVIPIDKIVLGQSISVTEIGRNAKNHPVAFALEAFAFVMMIVGAAVTCGWAYELGKAFGSAVG